MYVQHRRSMTLFVYFNVKDFCVFETAEVTDLIFNMHY